MDEPARGWMIALTHMRGHGAAWIAVMTGVGAAIWIVLVEAHKERKRGEPEAGDSALQPKPRTPIAGSDKDCRQPRP